MIERFIKDNREEFDDQLPPEGHSERFARRLKLAAQRRRLLRRMKMTAAAAILILVAGYAILAKNEEKAGKSCILSDEMRETRCYYASLLNDAKAQVERIVATAEPAVRSELFAELTSIATDSASFCNNSDQSAAIMIQYYGSKIVALRNIESVVSEMRNVKTLNTTHHEYKD